MESKNKDLFNQKLIKKNNDNLAIEELFSDHMGVRKKSIRPTRSIKRISMLPKRFIGISKVQKNSLLPEKNSESI